MKHHLQCCFSGFLVLTVPDIQLVVKRGLSAAETQVWPLASSAFNRVHQSLLGSLQPAAIDLEPGIVPIDILFYSFYSHSFRTFTNYWECIWRVKQCGKANWVHLPSHFNSVDPSRGRQVLRCPRLTRKTRVWDYNLGKLPSLRGDGNIQSIFRGTTRLISLDSQMDGHTRQIPM